MPTQHHSPDGTCPRCQAAVDRHDVLVEYETADGEQRAFAECPACEAVVSPEDGSS